MLENSDYTLGKRQIAKWTKQLYDDFGIYYSTTIIHMLHVKVNKVSKDHLLHPKILQGQNSNTDQVGRYQNLVTQS